VGLEEFTSRVSPVLFNSKHNSTDLYFSKSKSKLESEFKNDSESSSLIFL
jgi:hypothetical protein